MVGRIAVGTTQGHTGPGGQCGSSVLGAAAVVAAPPFEPAAAPPGGRDIKLFSLHTCLNAKGSDSATRALGLSECQHGVRGGAPHGTLRRRACSTSGVNTPGHQTPLLRRAPLINPGGVSSVGKPMTNARLRFPIRSLSAAELPNSSSPHGPEARIGSGATCPRSRSLERLRDNARACTVAGTSAFAQRDRSTQARPSLRVLQQQAIVFHLCRTSLQCCRA